MNPLGYQVKVKLKVKVKAQYIMVKSFLSLTVGLKLPQICKHEVQALKNGVFIILLHFSLNQNKLNILCCKICLGNSWIS